MPKSDRIRIQHALDAARQAIAFSGGCTADDLRRDERTTMATLYAISIVGEALGKVTADLKAAHPEIPWSKAAAMRNRLIHGYHDVDHAVVSDTVQSSLPDLVAMLEGLLARLDEAA